jgi:predicted RNase H-like HicB family nuclease
MHNEFTSVIEQDGGWFIGFCPEIPGANGQGRPVEECRASLLEAIALILEDRREDGLPMEKHLIGKLIPRKEGRKKVTGQALYVDDLTFPTCCTV